MSGRGFRWASVAAAAVFAAVVVLPDRAYSHKPITTNILFKNEIAQIFQRKCFQCHSENNLSVSFTTYTDARPWARAIREEILERNMPPWSAVPGYGHFANDIALNAREMEIIISWADGGAPSGVLKAEESIPPVYVPAEPSWDHGEPDAVFPISKGETIAAGAPFELRRLTVDTKLAAPRRVRAIALKQGDRRVVRHAAFYDATSGRWLGAWTPWQTASQLAENVVITLPANARIAVEIGYSGSDGDVIDASELGLYYAEAAGTAATAVKITAPAAAITSGAVSDAGTRLRTVHTLAAAQSAVALWPNPSDNARSIEITATSPEGVVTPLLWIKEYRPEWRSPYVLSEPIALARGTRITMTTYFDRESDQSVKPRAEAWLMTVPAAAARPAVTSAR